MKSAFKTLKNSTTDSLLIPAAVQLGQGLQSQFEAGAENETLG